MFFYERKMLLKQWYILSVLKRPFPTSLFCIIVFSIQMSVNKCSIWLDSNCGPLVSQVTTLTTEPQLLTAPSCLFFFERKLSLKYLKWNTLSDSNFGEKSISRILISPTDLEKINFLRKYLGWHFGGYPPLLSLSLSLSLSLQSTPIPNVDALMLR